MKPLTFLQYQTEVQNYPGSVILFFTAPWAVNQAVKTQDFLKSINLNVKLFSVDFDSEPELVEKFSVRFVPILYAIQNGTVKNLSMKCENQDDFYYLLGKESKK